MKVFEYKNYNEYVESQKEANEHKQHMSFVDKKTIKKIFDICGPKIQNVLCHGTRRGQEQEYFKYYYPKAEVIGSEIGISSWPMTVQHDFNEIREEWINKFDVIYSNSIDHAYDIENTITVWSNQLYDRGRMFIEKSVKLNSRAWDPVEISDSEMIELIRKLGLKMFDRFSSSGLGGREKTIVYGVTK
jgi:hypothetical protein